MSLMSMLKLQKDLLDASVQSLSDYHQLRRLSANSLETLCPFVFSMWSMKP